LSILPRGGGSPRATRKIHALGRPVLFLLVLAALACLAPLALFGADDDDNRPKKQNIKQAKAVWTRPAIFERMKAIPAVRIEPAQPERDAPSPVLASLDRAFDDSVRKCAPEMWGYDRKWLERLQGDWMQMKPNMVPQWEAWMSLEGIIVDEKRVAECKTILSGNDCDLMRQVWDTCTRPFTGTLGEDEACATHEQCASGRCLENKCTAPEGTCMKRSDCGDNMVCALDENNSYACLPAPREGDECADAYDEDQLVYVDTSCVAGLKCSDQGTCERPRAIGEACSPTRPCGDDAWCSYDDDGNATCVSDDEEEFEHDDDESCACDPERDGKYCVANDDGVLKCKPVELVQLGEACDEAHLCADSLGITACIEGRCQRALSHGDACSDHAQCKDDLVCIAGACSPPLHAGEACFHDDDCIFGLECVGNEEGETFCDVFKSVEQSYDYDTIQLGTLLINADDPALVDDLPPALVEDAPAIEDGDEG
jgi:hypothetical protein